jgi:hypothetical protein
VQPLPWFGSADLRAVTAAHGFVLFPAGEQRHRAGDCYPFLHADGRE